jgi:hypothetical protein
VLASHTNAIGCLLLCLALAAAAAWLAAGWIVATNIADPTRPQLPAYQTAALAVALGYLPAVALATALAGRGHRLIVFGLGLALSLASYLVAWKLLS